MQNKEDSDISGSVEAAKLGLERAQVALFQQPSGPEAMEEESNALLEYAKIRRYGESLYRQKPRVQGLNLGDSNTSYFFKAVKSSQAKTRIPGLNRDDDPSVYST